ncbi:hypothetical protein MMC15_007627 [Xylographa vitiligo]|nr:hypothetical protein [Xylographa vitiligo]
MHPPTLLAYLALLAAPALAGGVQSKVASGNTAASQEYPHSLAAQVESVLHPHQPQPPVADQPKAHSHGKPKRSLNSLGSVVARSPTKQGQNPPPKKKKVPPAKKEDPAEGQKPPRDDRYGPGSLVARPPPDSQHEPTNQPPSWSGHHSVGRPHAGFFKRRDPSDPKHNSMAHPPAVLYKRTDPPRYGPGSSVARPPPHSEHEPTNQPPSWSGHHSVGRPHAGFFKRRDPSDPKHNSMAHPPAVLHKRTDPPGYGPGSSVARPPPNSEHEPTNQPPSWSGHHSVGRPHAGFHKRDVLGYADWAE